MNKENNTPIEKLFGSKTRAKLLELFFANTNRSFYVREITRVVEEQINSVRRELMNLEGIGIVRSETFDNKVYYAANMKHPYARAFAMMFGREVASATAVQVQRKPSPSWDEYIRPVQKWLKGMILTNRAPGQDGIDLLIIGDDKTKKLTRWAEVIEQKQGKPLMYVIMERDDFLYRKSVRDRFIMDILDVEVSEMYDPEGIIKGQVEY